MIETTLLDALVARYGADNDFEAVGFSPAFVVTPGKLRQRRLAFGFIEYCG